MPNGRKGKNNIAFSEVKRQKNSTTGSIQSGVFQCFIVICFAWTVPAAKTEVLKISAGELDYVIYNGFFQLR